MRPTLRQLEYAVAVAEHRHFRRAAESCHVTQPALSTQIGQLEQILGVRIFERSRRHVHVTAAGERILERARACLREAADLEDLAAHLSRPGAAPIRLGIIPTMGPYLLPALLPALGQARPLGGVELWEDQTQALLERLDEGDLDLLLLALPIPHDDRPAREIAREPFVLVAPQSHPLARRDTLREEDLDGEELLLLAEGHCLRDHALAACKLARDGGHGAMHANSLAMLVQMVLGGMGITLLPASSVPVEAAGREGLAVRRFLDPAPSRILGAVWREGASRHEELLGVSDLAGSIASGAIERAIARL